MIAMELEAAAGSWEERTKRLGTISRSGLDHQHFHQAKHEKMQPAVRAAAMEGNVDRLLDALEGHSRRDLLPLSIILEQQTVLGDTLLHVAALSKSDGCARLVIDHFPDPLIVARNLMGDTALHVAARSGNLGCLGLLLRRVRKQWGIGGKDFWLLRMKNHGDNTPLHEAVSSRNHEVIGQLLDEDNEPLFWSNKQGKSALYLAVETGDPRILDLFLGVAMDAEAYASKVEGMSPVHAAVVGQHLGMLRAMSNMKRPLFRIKEVGGYTPLHLAVFTNYLVGVKFLIGEFSSLAGEHDDDGCLPIHLACKYSGVPVIDHLLESCEYPADLLNKEGQSIIHVAAKYGRSKIMMRLMRIPKLAELVNHRDRDGNTALHLAGAYWQPLTLLVLTWDPRVDIELRNYKCQTAFDVTCIHRSRESYPPMRQWLAAKVLLVAGAQGSRDLIVRPSGHKRELNPFKSFAPPPTLDRLQNKVGTQLIVATLIATVTFAAGFTLPGGVNGSESPDKGLAVLVNRGMFQAFIICNTIATYSSILVVIILLWTQATRDPSAVSTVYGLSVPPLKLALLSMSGAFFTGVYPGLHKLPWLQDVVLVTGIAFITAIISLTVVIHTRLGFQRRSTRWLTSVILIGFIFVSASWRYSSVLEEEERNHSSRQNQDEDGIQVLDV